MREGQHQALEVRSVKQSPSRGGFVMEIGARNRLDGEVINIKRGAVMCQVRVRIAGGAHMESVMTLDSADEMGLKVGDRVRVAVKAVNVLLLKD
jgi:molybdopterin-binding protein